MSDQNIYKAAAQQGLRFVSRRGPLTVEDLFKLPLQSTSGLIGFDLDSVAKAIAKELKDIGEESFVENSKNPRKAECELLLAVVKDVIATKQEENRAAADKRKAAEYKEKVLTLIDQKKDAALAALPIEELEKLVGAKS